MWRVTRNLAFQILVALLVLLDSSHDSLLSLFSYAIRIPTWPPRVTFS